MGLPNRLHNNSVAVSATGSGEKFIRTSTAFNISSQGRFQKLPLDVASQNALKEVADINGSGGVIVVDKKGNYAMEFNTAGIHRC